MTIRILNAVQTNDRADEIVSLVKRSYDSIIPEIATQLGVICADLGIAMIAEEDGRIVAAVIGSIRPDHTDGKVVFEELFFCVDPSHRGTTVGFRLMKALIQECKLRNVERIVLVALEGEYLQPMRRLMGAFNFKRYGEMHTLEVS